MPMDRVDGRRPGGGDSIPEDVDGSGIDTCREVRSVDPSIAALIVTLAVVIVIILAVMGKL